MVSEKLVPKISNMYPLSASSNQNGSFSHPLFWLQVNRLTQLLTGSTVNEFELWWSKVTLTNFLCQINYKIEVYSSTYENFEPKYHTQSQKNENKRSFTHGRQFFHMNQSKDTFIFLNLRNSKFMLKQELNITPKIAEYEKILGMDSILGE